MNGTEKVILIKKILNEMCDEYQKSVYDHPFEVYKQNKFLVENVRRDKI